MRDPQTPLGYRNPACLIQKHFKVRIGAMWRFLIAVMLFCTSFGLQEAEDGSVCFNNCSGHGTCVDYSCQCFVSYFGDDCRHTYMDENAKIPILGAGHYNLTQDTYRGALSKNKHLLLVGFSSYTCHKCIMAETEYHSIGEQLREEGQIDFARADSSQLLSFAQSSGVVDLPSLVVFKKRKPIPYRGVHKAESVLAFLDKVSGKPTRVLKTVQEVESFIASRDDPKYSLATVMVVGMFSDPDGIEEDEYEDFIEAAKALHHKEDVYMAVVKSRKIVQHFIDAKVIDRSPSMILSGEAEGDGEGDGSYAKWKSINLDELYGENLGIGGWIARNSIPLVGKLTHDVFPLYEKVGLPMLMMFLDLADEMKSSSPGRLAGGRSGGVPNEDLLRELRVVAKEHGEKIMFVYLDGNRHKDQMRSLGLFGGRERLPSLAFNTKDSRQIPFSEKLPINSDTLLQFCADFLSGKLQSAADAEEAARKALLSVKPINPKNKASRKKRLDPPEQVTGVAEQFGDANPGDTAVVLVDSKSFNDVVMDESKDVLLLLHAKECEPCAHLSVYFKRMAERFRALDIKSLTIARMDVSDESPPAHLNLMVSDLPILVLLPAALGEGGKTAPWYFFSGVGKVQSLMKWVQAHAAIPFHLPNLPHLNEDQVRMYKEQVREREEHLEKKRLEEEEALQKEEAAQAEAESRREARNKKMQEDVALMREEVEEAVEGIEADGFVTLDGDIEM